MITTKIGTTNGVHWAIITKDVDGFELSAIVKGKATQKLVVGEEPKLPSDVKKGLKWGA